jgi:ADP-ribosylglycohydrolase
MELQRRVTACLQGLATGDAIGKQTETLRRFEVRKWYPDGISGFHGRPGDVIPRYIGKRYEWRIGETTDDTEQTLAVARALLHERCVRHGTIGKELLACRKSVHPGVSMWAFSQAGHPFRMALDGDGCGAAMRVSPVGIVYPSSRLDSIVEGAYQCAIPTHGGQSAICAAAAVAAAVSAALDGCASLEVLDAALRASKMAESLVPSTRGYTIAASIAKVHADLSVRLPLSAEYIAQEHFPETPETIVPLAISLALITESAEETSLIAANIGGDTDSVASIGAAIAGALHPGTVNESWIGVVRSVNHEDIIGTAASLAAMLAKL